MLEEKIINNRYSHTIKIVRIVKKTIEKEFPSDDEDPFASDSAETTTVDIEETVYEGKGRVFTDTTTTGSKEVDYNKRKASIPVRYDEWGAGEQPLDGDTIYATIGNNTEIGRVRDSEPDNNRTLVYWEYVRV